MVIFIKMEFSTAVLKPMVYLRIWSYFAIFCCVWQWQAPAIKSWFCQSNWNEQKELLQTMALFSWLQCWPGAFTTCLYTMKSRRNCTKRLLPCWVQRTHSVTRALENSSRYCYCCLFYWRGAETGCVEGFWFFGVYCCFCPGGHCSEFDQRSLSAFCSCSCQYLQVCSCQYLQVCSAPAVLVTCVFWSNQWRQMPWKWHTEHIFVLLMSNSNMLVQGHSIFAKMALDVEELDSPQLAYLLSCMYPVSYTHLTLPTSSYV